jgi:sugar lactone lactonase YvrE
MLQIYRINTQTGTKQLVAIPKDDVTISSLFVSPDGNNLYFTDKNNGSINKIKLR